jgi:hypothetical protein
MRRAVIPDSRPRVSLVQRDHDVASQEAAALRSAVRDNRDCALGEMRIVPTRRGMRAP